MIKRGRWRGALGLLLLGCALNSGASPGCGPMTVKKISHWGIVRARAFPPVPGLIPYTQLNFGPAGTLELEPAEVSTDARTFVTQNDAPGSYCASARIATWRKDIEVVVSQDSGQTFRLYRSHQKKDAREPYWISRDLAAGEAGALTLRQAWSTHFNWERELISRDFGHSWQVRPGSVRFNNQRQIIRGYDGAPPSQAERDDPMLEPASCFILPLKPGKTLRLTYAALTDGQGLAPCNEVKAASSTRAP